mmetsp:Transcript_42331/g.108276  ORF Transcript_42331/g.108276 Transcript_42331/m.108276 type:complete len:421 (+) Transcript_42331:154-1416(+)
MPRIHGRDKAPHPLLTGGEMASKVGAQRPLVPAALLSPSYYTLMPTLPHEELQPARLGLHDHGVPKVEAGVTVAVLAVAQVGAANDHHNQGEHAGKREPATECQHAALAADGARHERALAQAHGALHLVREAGHGEAGVKVALGVPGGADIHELVALGGELALAVLSVGAAGEAAANGAIGVEGDRLAAEAVVVHVGVAHTGEGVLLPVGPQGGARGAGHLALAGVADSVEVGDEALEDSGVLAVGSGLGLLADAIDGALALAADAGVQAVVHGLAVQATGELALAGLGKVGLADVLLQAADNARAADLHALAVRLALLLADTLQNGVVVDVVGLQLLQLALLGLAGGAQALAVVLQAAQDAAVAGLHVAAEGLDIPTARLGQNDVVAEVGDLHVDKVGHLLLALVLLDVVLFLAEAAQH